MPPNFKLRHYRRKREVEIPQLREEYGLAGGDNAPGKTPLGVAPCRNTG
jgi:hypothetical protein